VIHEAITYEAEEVPLNKFSNRHYFYVDCDTFEQLNAGGTPVCVH